MTVLGKSCSPAVIVKAALTMLATEWTADFRELVLAKDKEACLPKFKEQLMALCRAGNHPWPPKCGVPGNSLGKVL